METKEWVGNCHCVATRLVETRLVPGNVRYGFYYGPVSGKSYFSSTAPFHRHGWIELPDGLFVVDPTRWVFEARKPYIFMGPYSNEYDPGNQRMAQARLRPCPGRLPGDEVFEVCLSAPAAQHLSDMTGYGTAFSLVQLCWIANLPLNMLGVHCVEIYRELARIGQKDLIPIDNWDMAMGPGGPPAHALCNPFAD
jgi:hypothetical protein